MKKFIKWTAIVLGGCRGFLKHTAMVLYRGGNEKLTRTYTNLPVESVLIPTGQEALAHGRHIAIIWGCTKCHGEDLSGELIANDPFLGTIPASNLTSGTGGIGGSYTDIDWVRAIRYGVKPDSHAELFMNDYAAMSDGDLGDLIAYLRQIPPVDTEFPAMKYGPLVPLAPAVGFYIPAAELSNQNTAHPADPAPAATTEYGKYLFTICTECHSNNLANNLEQWNQEDFTRAVRTGVLPSGRQLPAAMSAKTFGEMNDTELAALWLYLQSLLPAK